MTEDQSNPVEALKTKLGDAQNKVMLLQEALQAASVLEQNKE